MGEYIGRSAKDIVRDIKLRGHKKQLYTLEPGSWFMLHNGRVLHIKTYAHNNQRLDSRCDYGTTMKGSFCKFNRNREVYIPTDEDVIEFLKLTQLESKPQTNCGTCNKNCAHRTSPCMMYVHPVPNCCCPHCGGGA